MFQSRKVLVVDDDSVVGHSINRVLTEQGYQVREAMSGSEALEELDHQQYDMVFTDIRMPGMDGLDMASRMKKSHPEMPVRGHHRVRDGGERKEGARPRGGRFPAQAAVAGYDHRERRARAARAGRDPGGDQAVRAGADDPGRGDRGRGCRCRAGAGGRSARGERLPRL